MCVRNMPESLPPQTRCYTHDPILPCSASHSAPLLVPAHPIQSCTLMSHLYQVIQLFHILRLYAAMFLRYISLG